MLDFRSWTRRARQVISLLAEERALLREGRIDELARVADRRDRLVDQLSGEPVEAGEENEALLETIRREAGRNQRLLGAFLEGMRAAGQRLARIERSQTEIGLYGAQGTRLPDPAPDPTSDRRA